MAEHGMLSSAGKLVYLTMNTGKWPPAANWAHGLNSWLLRVFTIFNSIIADRRMDQQIDGKSRVRGYKRGGKPDQCLIDEHG